MVTSYKSMKSEKLNISLFCGFDDFQVTKIKKTQKLKEKEVDLSEHAQINFLFLEVF